ncbi:tRNA-splicing endonuclease subunit Sen54 isoform X2 [Narcine bancroftii]|uniref:tRNA-splicing endonuclease subunit Sen54 isoform X2 n=1 Tax=Narcine bancroftii TaxID=1343680 RepID=UPI003831808D
MKPICGCECTTKSVNCEELFSARFRDHKLPQQTHGQKDFIPDHSEEQAERLRLCREEEWQLLAEERVERLGSLVKAQWNPQEGVVELKSNAGKFWHTMGHVNRGKQLLYPEEALYLLECGSIQLFYGDLPLSIQESYEVLLSSRTIPLQNYQVYSHLKRLGYIVMRFDPSTICSSFEGKMHLDPCSDENQHHRKRKRSCSQHDTRSKKSHYDQFQEEEPGQSIKEGQEQDEFHQQDTTCKTLEKDPREPTPASPESKMEKLGESNVGSSDGQPAEQKQASWPQKEPLDFVVPSLWSPRESVVPAGKPRWDFEKIQFPNIGRDRPLTQLTAPNPTLLPMNVVGRASDATMWQEKINQKHEKLSQREQERIERESRHKTDINMDKRIRQCANWKEYKELLRWKNAQNEKLPVHLWKDKVEPLVKPGHVSSLGEIQQRICIMKSAQILDKTPWSQEASEGIRIYFDVYQADTVAKFRKTQPGKPFSRMCVCSFNGPVPDLRTLKKLAFQSGEVPVVFAVVDNGDISFYAFKDFKLPVDVYQ